MGESFGSPLFLHKLGEKMEKPPKQPLYYLTKPVIGDIMNLYGQKARML